MITIPRSVRIFIGSTPIDMRKSIDGLMSIVQDELEKDAYSGHLFVFVSRRCDRVKILTWDKGGFVLVYKRLERGQFKLPHMDPSTMAVEIDATQLAMLLDGSTSAASAGPSTGSPSRIVRAVVPWTSPLRRDLQSPMGGDDHRCEWRERAEALEARLAQSEATLEKLQRHQFGARSEKMPSVAEAIRDPARAEAERIAAQQKRRENAEKKRQLVTRKIVHEVREHQKSCPKCGGHDFMPLGEGKVTELYELVPARIERQLHVQQKVRCRCGALVLSAATALAFRLRDPLQRLWIPSAVAVLAENFVLATSFYPALGRYQPGRHLAAELARRGIDASRLRFVDRIYQPLQLYAGRVLPVLDEAGVERERAAGHELVLVVGDDGLRRIRDAGIPHELLLETPDCPVLKLKWRMVDPRTRDRACPTAHVLAVPPQAAGAPAVRGAPGEGGGAAPGRAATL